MIGVADKKGKSLGEIKQDAVSTTGPGWKAPTPVKEIVAKAKRMYTTLQRDDENNTCVGFAVHPMMGVVFYNRCCFDNRRLQYDQGNRDPRP